MSHVGSALRDFLPDEPWREAALCRSVGGDAFFPEKGARTSAARRICQRCPVRQQCLDFALEHNERWGIWGGTSEKERRRMQPPKDGELPPMNYGLCGTDANHRAHQRRDEEPCAACKAAHNRARWERVHRKRPA